MTLYLCLVTVANSVILSHFSFSSLVLVFSAWLEWNEAGFEILKSCEITLKLNPLKLFHKLTCRL